MISNQQIKEIFQSSDEGMNRTIQPEREIPKGYCCCIPQRLQNN